MPSIDSVPPLLRQQLGPLLDQALEDGPEGLSLIQPLEVRRDGEHVFDLQLFCDDDGIVHNAGTLERVASFSQGGATGTDDVGLRASLDRAYATFHARRRRTPAPRPIAASRSTSAEVPRLGLIDPRHHLELGKKLPPTLGAGLLCITAPPTPALVETLTSYLATRASGFVVEIGAKVPLSVLAHLGGVPFVVFAAGRKSFDGLEALPSSVRRLSIRKHARVSLATLPKQNGLTSMEIEANHVTPGPLPHLETLGWTGATDTAWLSALPRLRELALKGPTIQRLPTSASLERLLLLKPTHLETLQGVEALPRLTFLCIVQPKGMKSLGHLASCKALTSIALVGAHAIGDLSSLVSAPALQHLRVTQSNVDPEAFMGLKGKLTGGSFQLRLPKQGMALLAALDIPFVKPDRLDNHFFDTP